MNIERLGTCKHCGKSGFSDDNAARFCPACGAPLVNECSSYECEQILSLEDAFCKYCGSSSTFLNIGFVEADRIFATHNTQYEDPFGA